MSVSGMKAERQRYNTDMAAQEAPDSGPFLGQTVLVAGGGGIVGSAIVALVLREGGTVFAPVRTEESERKLFDLLQDVPTQRLRTIVGDYNTKPGALRLTTFLNTFAQRGLNHVVSIHGDKHYHATLQDITSGQFQDTMNTKVLPHIIVAQAAMAHVNNSAECSYSIVTGSMGQRCEKPDEALLCIANAASYGVASALRAQCRAEGKHARVPEMRIGCVVKRDAMMENPGFPGWKACNASDVARFWAQQVARNSQASDVVHVGEAELGGTKGAQASQQQQQGSVAGQKGKVQVSISEQGDIQPREA